MQKTSVATIGSKERRRAESDHRMLRAAAALIGRHGTTGTSLGQIGIEAGYSRGLPTQRFGTKLVLLEAVIDAMEERFMRVVQRNTADLSGCEALAERIRLQIVSVHEMPDFANALYHMIVDSTGAAPELQPRIAQLHHSYHDNLQDFLRQARDLGELRDDVELDQAARVISGAISGLCIQALVDQKTARLASDALLVIEVFLTRFAKPGIAEHVVETMKARQRA